MTYDARELARIRNAVLLVSAVAWGVLLIGPQSMGLQIHCSAMDLGEASLPGSSRGWRAFELPGLLWAGWLVMLAAMMSPVLVSPVRHICQRSFRNRQARSILLFTTGYLLAWTAAGVVPLAIGLMVALLAPQSYLPAAAAALIAMVWQFSPIKQRCLNRCYAHPALAAFGRRADLDALRFGAAHGAWCAGSCWILMSLPLLLPVGHLFAMAFISVLIFSERLESPRPPSWRCRGLGTVTRILIAQTRMLLSAPAR